MKKEDQIIFFGTPNLAAIILEMLVSQYPNLLVVTQPDKPVGRNQVLTPSPVKVLAQKHRLPVHDYTDSQKITNLLKKHRPCLTIVAVFGKILPPEILKIPKLKTLGVHPSLLPQYRGATPVQTAILNGGQETGVTIFLVDEEMDHGPILAQRKAPISPSDTAPVLKKRLAKLGGQLLIKTIPDWFEGKIKPQPQNHHQATCTHLLTKKDGFVEWKKLILATQNKTGSPKQAKKIDRTIRAYTPWPGVWTKIKPKDKKLKVLKAHLEDKKLILDQVQLEGKNPISWKEFSRGYPHLLSPESFS